GKHLAVSLDAAMRDRLLRWVDRPPPVIRVPDELRQRFEDRKRSDIQRVLPIGGLCGIVLALLIVAARFTFYRGVGTPAEETLYAEITAFNFAVIVTTVVALQVPRAFRHYRALMVAGGATVL